MIPLLYRYFTVPNLTYKDQMLEGSKFCAFVIHSKQGKIHIYRIASQSHYWRNRKQLRIFNIDKFA
jgi:hypothetical protein